MLIILKIFNKCNGQRNNPQNSLKGKLEINPHLILFIQMNFQIHLTPPLNLFQILSILPIKKGFCNQPLHHLAKSYSQR